MTDLSVRTPDDLLAEAKQARDLHEIADLLMEGEFVRALAIAHPATYELVANEFRSKGWSKTATRESVVRIRRKMKAELVPTGEDAWVGTLQFTPQGGVAPTMPNALTIMENSIDFHNLFAFDSFSLRLMLRTCPPWATPQEKFPAEVTDQEVSLCTRFLSQAYDSPFLAMHVWEAIAAVAHLNQFDPLREYLEGLEWDGVNRLSSLMPMYFGTQDTRLNRAFGKRFLIQAVARALDPGCQADAVLVLEGAEGLKKSSALATLAGKTWFTSEALDIRSPEVPYQIGGKWIIELGEFESLKSVRATATKEFITRRTDRYRPKYGRSAIDVPRRCVFIPTTNDERYLTSVTGNRRFWPMRIVDRIDIDSIHRDRDEIWAEAVWRYQEGERYWFDDERDQKLIKAQIEATEARQPEDPWLPTARSLPAGTSTHELLDAVGVPVDRRGRWDEQRAGEVLRMAGYSRRRVMRKGVRSYRFFRLA